MRSLPLPPFLRPAPQHGFIALLLLSFFALTLGAWDGLVNILTYWERDAYSHGYLIPFIAVLIGWHRLVQARPAAAPSWHGVWVLLAGFALIGFSTLTAFEALVNYSFILGLVGLSLAFLGRRATAALAPAFVFLLFAAPLPHLVYGNLSLQMQLVSSTLGVKALEALGISVFQDGNIIDLGLIKLQVAEACNGLQYLFPLMSIGFLVAFLLEDRLWKRAVLFLSAAPITIGMNSLRIAIIGITSNAWGVEMAEGFIHIFEGYVVFLLCLLLLLAEMWVLMRIGPRGRFRHEYFSLPSGPVLAAAPRLRAPSFAAFVACLLCGLFLYAGPLKNRTEVYPPAPDFGALPLTLGAMKASPIRLEPEIIDTLKLTDYYLADYEADEGAPPVNFYIAYYKSQHMRENIHAPLGCILGSGWHVAKQQVVPLAFADGTQTALARMVIRREKESLLVYYWFDQRGRVLTNQFQAKYYLFMDSLALGRTDGALVRLTTPIRATETEEQADQRLTAFLEQVFPLVKQVLPTRPVK